MRKGRGVSRETLVSAQVAVELLRRAREAGECRIEPVAGWSRINSGPEKILAVFRPLELKSGYFLTGYRFEMGGNGNGFVYAVPEGTYVPDPDECSVDSSLSLEPPVPPGAMDDIMDAIEGDGTPLSFLCASFLERELSEFGAMWHGCEWSTHELVTRDPFSVGGLFGEGGGISDRGCTPHDADAWRWHREKPGRWEPLVKMGRGYATVTFFTHSGLGREAIYCHVDKFPLGTYRAKSRRIVVAEGPGGFVF